MLIVLSLLSTVRRVTLPLLVSTEPRVFALIIKLVVTEIKISNRDG